ncbi:MAG: DUF3105 domain-containing protein [Candidatus Saccharibacteria bacterium]
MSNKFLFITLSVVAIGTIGFVMLNNSKIPDKPRLGTAQTDQGRTHIKAGEKITYKSAIPTSGPHGQEAPWGYSATQYANENVIHNMEHGGIVVSYRPDLDVATINKIKALYTSPFSTTNFQPNKVVIMPRAGQQKPIVLASWNRLLELDSYNQQTLIDYYLTNVGKSPEPTAT